MVWLVANTTVRGTKGLGFHETSVPMPRKRRA
jgi:hypothetical protein